MESDGPQGTEFVDIEAGGFDEGQGETNVSDKAEPENIVRSCCRCSCCFFSFNVAHVALMLLLSLLLSLLLLLLCTC